ncbi:hypothetical protein GCM10010136_32730 [Limoniibacter endophyticus]|uniref:Lipopolysaccharide assembly protein A domain-containing protein n=2 Tax=Limoniibacter endophyticus TaxID=1565040 RepID=A0A8J3GHL3_9HYPH|nr:hypothetical protein GCM10010136_32730 [Limoniibacter endophyticus]
MINRLVVVLIIVPMAALLIAFSVANRAPTLLTFDPFNPGNPALSIQLPLFLLLFVAFALGLLAGSMITWSRQSRYRKLARERDREAQSLRHAAKAQGQQSVPALRP